MMVVIYLKGIMYMLYVIIAILAILAFPEAPLGFIVASIILIVVGFLGDKEEIKKKKNEI